VDEEFADATALGLDLCAGGLGVQCAFASGRLALVVLSGEHPGPWMPTHTGSTPCQQRRGPVRHASMHVRRHAGTNLRGKVDQPGRHWQALVAAPCRAVDVLAGGSRRVPGFRAA
jgi:hypothetical protein